MKYRSLGKTGLTVSIVGFGASPLGAEFGTIDPTEGKRAVDRAIELEINYFDVAPYYGRTLAEKRLGAFLQGKRDRVILATKVGRYDKDLPDGFDFSAARVIRSVEESLRRLGTDVIDILQVHDIEFGEKEQIISETLPALYRLKEQGKIRFAGITGYPLGILQDIASSGMVDTILSYCHYNLMNTSLDRMLAPFCSDRHIGLINASPLHMRVLTRKGAPGWHPAPTTVLEAGRRASEWCAAQGVDIADIAMQFALMCPSVATTIVGMSKQIHVDKNVKSVGVEPDAEILAGVLKMIRPVKDINWIVGLPENNDPGSVTIDE